MTVVAGANGFGRVGEGCEEEGAMENLEKENEYGDADCGLGVLVRWKRCE
jgi:hypothetical protein